MAATRQKLGHAGNGVSYESIYDEKEDRLIINGTQDVQAILDQNAAKRNQFRGYKGEFHQVATIPNVIVDKLMREGIWQDPARLKAWLNDPDNKYFRTSTGNV